MTFIAASAFMVLAPNVGISLPSAPAFPTLTVSNSSDWLTQAGNTLRFVGSVIWYFLSYVGYIFSMTGVALSLISLGFIPASVGTATAALTLIVIVGGIMMYLRGNGGGK